MYHGGKTSPGSHLAKSQAIHGLRGLTIEQNGDFHNQFIGLLLKKYFKLLADIKRNRENSESSTSAGDL